MERATVISMNDELPAWLKLAVSVLVATALFALLNALPLRYFVNDDFQLLYTTWLRSSGLIPNMDFAIQSFHVLPEFLRPLLYLADQNPERLWILRIPFFICLTCLPILLWYITRQVVGSTAAPFAALGSIFSWGVLERGLDIRPDLLITILVLAQLAIVVRGRLRLRDIFLAGMLSALMAILRVKSLIFLPLIVIWLIISCDHDCGIEASRRSLIRRISAFGGGTLLAGGFLLLFISWLGLLPAFIDGNGSLSRLAAQHMGGSQISLDTWALISANDKPWLVFFACGILALMFRPMAMKTRQYLIALFVTVGAYILLNPALYAYNLVVLLPLLSPFFGLGCAELLRLAGGKKVKQAVAIGLAALGVIPHIALLTNMATLPTNRHQLDLIKALATTPPETHTFSLEGIGLFRPSLYDWRLSYISVGEYRKGQIDLMSQLQSTKPEIIIRNYRIPGWLDDKDQKWLSQHYVKLSPRLFVLGTVSQFGETVIFKTARHGQFEVSEGAFFVDGVRYPIGSSIWLPAGNHVLQGADITNVLRYDWPAGKALPSSFKPYLIPPDRPQYYGW